MTNQTWISRTAPAPPARRSESVVPASSHRSTGGRQTRTSSRPMATRPKSGWRRADSAQAGLGSSRSQAGCRSPAPVCRLRTGRVTCLDTHDGMPAVAPDATRR